MINLKYKVFLVGAICVIFLLCVLFCVLCLSGCSSKELTLSDYKDIDYSFLSSFDYGQTKRQEAVCTFNTIEELQSSVDESLVEDAYISVKSYYGADDLGGASYVISKEETSGSITLQNGLYANLIADNHTVGKQEFAVLNIKQFGAKGDGVTADQNAINDAVAYINSNIESKAILYMPKGEYRVDNEILANDMQDVIITGAGDDTVIFTDNEYKSYWEFFFACWRDEDCFLGNFKIEARENINYNKYYRQLTLIDCNNVYLYNITLNVPESAWSGESFVDKQYTNLTMYSGDKNIVVDSCVMYQMSGTYRGANIGIMDFYQRGTENITIKNCELHDNARDEQVGIFSLSFMENSYVKGVNFLDNKVFTHPTPYRDIVGARTMCFTVAYGNNDVSDINIEGNEFVSYADSKFMTFGSVKNCTVKNNKITVFANHGNAGYVFDSSCTNDGDVVVEGNDFYLTYASTPNEGKCVSAGHITFKDNTVVADCTVYKIADRLGIYQNNNFKMLGSFGSCGSALKFNNNTVTSYGEHSNYYNEIMFNHSGDSAISPSDTIEFVGNTVTDYTYYDGAKNQKVFDKLCVINSITIKELRITDNVYNCPNYKYTSASDYMWICWVRSEANISNFVCENNDLQGANVVYGAEGGDNTLREFNTDIVEPKFDAVTIFCEDTKTSKSKIQLSANADNVEWFVFGNGASIENGALKFEKNGTYKVFAASTDGSGVYASVDIQYVGKRGVSAVAIIAPIVCVAIAVVIIAIVIVVAKRKRKA